LAKSRLLFTVISDRHSALFATMQGTISSQSIVPRWVPKCSQ